MQQPRTLETVQFGRDAAVLGVGRQQAHVAKRFRPDAAEPNHQHLTPGRIAPRARNQFDAAARRHGFDQNSVEDEIGPRRRDAGRHVVPGGAQRLLVGDPDGHAADVALVHE